jgi:hypothetical protein
MRRTLISLAAAALVVAPLSAAEAGPSRYRVTTVSTDKTLDLTSDDGTNRTTVIKGRVTGGKVAGKKVYIYASNTSARNQAFRYIGSDRLSSSGRFATKWKPKDGGSYVVNVVKPRGAGRAEGSDRTRVNVFKFVSLTAFYDRDPAKSAVVRRVDKAGSIRGQNWSKAYEIAPGASAVFATQGYRCLRINFKIGVADRAPAGTKGSFRVTQGGRVLKGTHRKGQRFIQPSTKQQKRMRANQPVTVSVAGKGPFVLGLPKAACTYPTRSTPKR